METVTNVVNSASEAIWGKSNTEQRTAQNETAGKEPVSGVTGAGNADEPFDKGNAEDVNPIPSTSERTQPTTRNPQTSGTADSTGANVNTADKKESISFGSTPNSADVQDTTADAVKRAESGERITDEEREQLAEAGKLPKDPNDHSGEPMKMHGGPDSLDSAQKTERAKSVSQEGGGEHGKAKGTGTEYVKSSGLAADGGDFDAANPGAGREATRLLEEKGIKHDGDNHGAPAPEMPAGTGEKLKEKSSLSDKIKDKLHIGTGKHV